MSKSNRKGRSGHHSRGKHSHSDKHEEEAPPEVFSQTLSIIVYRGDPIDSYLNRHTAFYIEYSDGSNVLSHITGASGFFAFDERWNEARPPQQSAQFERGIPVATIQSSNPQDLTIRNILYNTPINNNERSWNCQHWIGDGLRRLQEADIIPENIANNAADQMVDVLMEAPMEDPE